MSRTQSQDIGCCSLLSLERAKRLPFGRPASTRSLGELRRVPACPAVGRMGVG